MHDHWVSPFPPIRETHDALRQRELSTRARMRAEALASDSRIVAVLLSGSVARGPVGESSDIDLHVVLSGSAPNLAPWTFHPDGTLENLHLVPLELWKAGQACVEQDLAFAEWCFATSLGDHLRGAQVLHPSSALDEWSDGLYWLQRARERQAVRNLLAHRYRVNAAALIADAGVHQESGRLQDVHYVLRLAVQSLLIAAMVECGGYIRGSKKRPEIACPLSQNRGVRESLELLLDVMSIRCSSPEQARASTESRLVFRSILMDLLAKAALRQDAGAERAQRLARLAEREIRHHHGAHDYYAPLLRNGFWRGALNHVRALSGFHLVPLRLVEAWDGEPSAAPIARFRELFGHHEELGSWWEVMALEPRADLLSEWIRRAHELATSPGATPAT